MKTVDIAQAKVQPVLMILTHPFRGVKNLLITLRCLERYTDLRSFKKIYILANASFGEHLLLIQKYVKKYPGLFQDVHCSPAGHNPCVAHMQNLIHEMHFNDVILKMDDDMFVTPGWLPPLLETWQLTADDPRMGLLMPLVPVNVMGAKILWDFLGHEYGLEFKELWIRGLQISHNQYYHLHIWNKVMDDGMIEKFQSSDMHPRHVYTGFGCYASINCVLYDKRMIDRVYPYPIEEAWFPDGEKRFDESIMMRPLSAGDLDLVVDTRSVVHHVAFNPVQEEVVANLSMDRIYNYVMALGSRTREHRQDSPPTTNGPLDAVA